MNDQEKLLKIFLEAKEGNQRAVELLDAGREGTAAAIGVLTLRRIIDIIESQ
jgi:hypothetical protein